MYQLDKYESSGKVEFGYGGREIVMTFNAHSIHNYMRIMDMSRTLKELQRNVLDINDESMTGEEAERLGSLAKKACDDVQELLVVIFGKGQWDAVFGPDFSIEDFDAIGFFVTRLTEQFARAYAEKRATELSKDEV